MQEIHQAEANVKILGYYYDHGMHCRIIQTEASPVTSLFMTRAEALAAVYKHQAPTYVDMHCKLASIQY